MADDPYAGLDPKLATAVRNLLAEAKGKVWVVSGHRSRQEQAALYANRGSNPYPVAAPGSSPHERGDAVDLGGDLSLARRLAAQFGLAQPVAGDPVHFELAGPPATARTMNGSAAGGRYPGFVDRFLVWKEAGGPTNGALGSFAAAVSKAENPAGIASTISKPNRNGSVDIGLWQINSSHVGQTFNGPDGKPFKIESQQWLQDPTNNARAAYALSRGGHDWHAWCTAYSDNACGTQGGKYLERGSRAVASFTDAAGAVTSGTGILGLLTLGAAGPGATEIQGPQPGAPSGIRTACDTGKAAWKVGPFTVLNECQAQALAGGALMVAGSTIILIGTVVILFRFQATRTAATAAAAAVPVAGPVVSTIAGRGSGPGPARRRSQRTTAAAQQRRDEDRAAAPQRAYDISKARQQGARAGQGRSFTAAEQAFPD